MVRPPTNGRSKKVLNGVSGGASEAFGETIGDLLLFNDVMIYLWNAHATQTIDYTIYGCADLSQATPKWETLKNQATLAASTTLVLTHADIADLDAAWDGIKIGYVRTDGSNAGTLHAWINRK